MDIATGLGLIAGGIVLVSLILMGGNLGMFADSHAFIVIFGGSFSATLIRFPLASMFHGLPLGARFAFTTRCITQRELVDEIAELAEIARKQGPIGLEKVEIEDPFLAKGIRFVADGYDGGFIRDNLERDRDMLVAFSTQDQVKLQVVTGSMRDAFGVQDRLRCSGVIEVDGLPTRPKLKNAAPVPPEEASPNPTPDERGSQQSFGAKLDDDRMFALASASLRQALQDMPELAEVSKHIMIEETKQGLNIEIVDQNGR